MERLTWLTRFAFAALVSLAVVDCGGDDGAGTGDGNGTDDGNGDDTGGPNPLIEKIPGFWYWAGAEDQPNPELQRDMERPNEVVVDTTDPACVAWMRSRGSSRYAPLSDEEKREYERLNAPGDGCLRPPTLGLDGLEGINFIILDGNEVRRDEASLAFRGTVTEDGRSIDITYTANDGRISGPDRYRKVR